MVDIDTILTWRGRTVRDRDGEKVGTLGDLYLDETDRPAYAGVKTGLFRSRESIVPLDGAYETDDGDVHVRYALETIKASPNVEPDVALEGLEEAQLRDHYGEPTQMRRETAEVTRSEEEVDFRVKPAKPKERVRLKKYVVTEHVKKTVPVRREEVRVVDDPPERGRVVRVEDIDESS
jgi:PRC-barrel domain